MFALILGLAWAGDHLPAWDATTPDEDAPSLDEGSVHRREAVPSRVPARRLSMGEEPSATHDWLDPSRLTLSIRGEWGRRYYAVCTAVHGEAVAHWEQGPFDAPDMTEIVSLSVPDEVISWASDAVLSCRVVGALFDGSSVRRYGLPTLQLDGLTGAVALQAPAHGLTTEEE